MTCSGVKNGYFGQKPVKLGGGEVILRFEMESGFLYNRRFAIKQIEENE